MPKFRIAFAVVELLDRRNLSACCASLNMMSAGVMLQLIKFSIEEVLIVKKNLIYPGHFGCVPLGAHEIHFILVIYHMLNKNKYEDCKFQMERILIANGTEKNKKMKRKKKRMA